MKRHFGPFAPVASAGATAMDVCLPVILKVSGSEILPAEYMRILSQKKVFRTEFKDYF